jgi:hypothetical protein
VGDLCLVWVVLVAAETLRVVAQLCRLRILKVSGQFPGWVQVVVRFCRLWILEVLGRFRVLEVSGRFPGQIRLILAVGIV